MRAAAFAVVILALADRADAHDVRGEALILDIADDAVDAELHVPAAQLALANEPDRDLGSLVRTYVRTSRSRHRRANRSR